MQKFILLVPINEPKDGLVANAAAGLPGQCYIHAGREAVFIGVIVGRVIITADHQLGQGDARGGHCGGAGAQRDQCQQQEKRNQNFLGVHKGMDSFTGNIE